MIINKIATYSGNKGYSFFFLWAKTSSFISFLQKEPNFTVIKKYRMTGL